MILALTPNPATDITCGVDVVRLGTSHRVTSYAEHAGGKGVNTAGVLHAMGREVVALAPVASADHDSFAEDLNTRGILHQLTVHQGTLRKSVAVVDAWGEASLYNQVGKPLPPSVWGEVLRGIRVLAPRASVLTISGSLPPESPPDLIAELTECAHDNDVLVVLDVSGPELRSALSCAPDLVKPNMGEAANTLGVDIGTPLPAEELAQRLVAEGAQAAVVSDGSKGLTMVDQTRTMHARLGHTLAGNPTGAGDALTAALAASLDASSGLPKSAQGWATALTMGVAWSAAAVLQPLAGAIDPLHVIQLAKQIHLEETTS